MKLDPKKEVKKIVSQVKGAQGKLQDLIQDNKWIDDAKKYAERQGKDLKKLISSDVGKVMKFLEKEKKEIEKFQKQIPAEVKKLKTFVNTQKKEFEKLLGELKKSSLKAAIQKKPVARKVVKKPTSVGTKTTAPKKSKKSASSTAVPAAE